MTTTAYSNVYSRVHKGLRKALFDLAYMAGRTDYTNAAERASLRAQSNETLQFLIHHGHIEDTVVLPLLEAKIPGVSKNDIDDHVRIHDEVYGLQLMLDAIQDCPTPEECQRAGEEYYLKVNIFIADYLTHMNHEEVVMAPLFNEHYTQEELQGIHRTAGANSSPKEMMVVLRYMVPSIDPLDRAMLIGDIKQGAPAPAFEATMMAIKGTLDENEWTALHASLN